MGVLVRVSGSVGGAFCGGDGVRGDGAPDGMVYGCGNGRRQREVEAKKGECRNKVEWEGELGYIVGDGGEKGFLVWLASHCQRLRSGGTFLFI